MENEKAPYAIFTGVAKEIYIFVLSSLSPGEVCPQREHNHIPSLHEHLRLRVTDSLFTNKMQHLYTMIRTRVLCFIDDILFEMPGKGALQESHINQPSN
jgi:hypothetical protein